MLMEDNPTMDLLKINALDRADLEVLSANLQDAVISMGDMRYIENQQQFIMVLNRFDWKDALNPKRQKSAYKRHRAGLQFGHVLNVKQLQLNHVDDEAVVALLSLEFEETEAPSGIITLVFAAGGAIKLEVECIEARLSDLGMTWQTDNLPDHDKD